MARAIVRDKTKQDAQIELKQFQLSSLLEITQAINQNFSAEQLYSIYKFVCRTQLKIKRLSLIVSDEGWTETVSYGLALDTDSIDADQYLKGITAVTAVTEDFPKAFQQFQAIIPVIHKDKPLAYALIGDISLGLLELKDDLLPFIQTLTNIIIVAIENKKFAREQIRQQAIKIELALAAQMQTMLIPDDLPNDKDLEMHASYLPHQEIGGDYYDYIKINEDELIFCMADVSGKGIPAALLMSNFQANLSALVRITTELPPLITELNTKVMESARGEKFITLFLAKYNRKQRMLSYVNSGHNPPFLLIDGKAQLLEDGTTGLGMIDNLISIKEGKVHVPEGSVFLSYTDGVVETENEQGEAFGMTRLSDFLERNALIMSRSEFNNKLIQELVAFKGKKKFADDVTILVCYYN